MKAKLTFEIDGKAERIWSLDCGTDAINTFGLLKMGYFNGTYLQCISKEFDSNIEIEEEKSIIIHTTKILKLSKGVNENIINSWLKYLEKRLKELE